MDDKQNNDGVFYGSDDYSGRMDDLKWRIQQEDKEKQWRDRPETLNKNMKRKFKKSRNW